MARDFTASTLIARARTMGWLPSSPDSASDAEILAMMTSDSRLGLAALIRSIDGQYGAEYVSVTSSSSGVELPAHVSAQNLVAVEYLWTTSNTYARLPQIRPDSPDILHAPTPAGWYLVGSRLFIAPTSWVGTFRLLFQALAPVLVASTDAVQIATVASSTTVTVAANPSAWGTSLTLDVIRNAPGGEAIVRGTSVTRSSTTYTFPSTSGFSVGDWLALEGESPVPALSVELAELLALRVAATLASASGAPNSRALMKLAEDGTKAALELIAPRGMSVEPIVSYDAPGRFWPARRRGGWF